MLNKCQQPDGNTCPDVPNKFLLMAHRVDIRIVSFDVNYVLDVVLPISNLKNASGVDVNLVNGEIYWTDPGEDVIKRTNFNGSFVETVINTGIDVADSLVVDSIGRKVTIIFRAILWRVKLTMNDCCSSTGQTQA